MASETRDDLRIKVAQCCRMLEWMGLIDYSGHVSARLPGTDRILINPRDQSRVGLRPEHLIEVNLDGKILGGDGKPPNEVFIHTEAYKARPDVRSVAHVHSPMSVTLSVAGLPFTPVIYHGALFSQGVPLYNDSRHVNSPERGAALAKTLGRCRAAVIRGHGAIVVGDSVEGVFYTAVYMEDNATKLYQASLLGKPIPLPPHELAEGAETHKQYGKMWSYFLEKTGLSSARF
ncbi:MAG TPA: class II aldolase/adducin family protein [bacterium]|nr:class II aldolase/adducin family protein [bacterium]